MKILTCGDLALCRGVEKKILEGNSSDLLSDFYDIFSDSDLFLANVEVPLTDSETPLWTHFRTLKAKRKTGKFLGDIGVNIASLANNHIADYGKRGMVDTISVLEEQKIAWVGAGWPPEEARRPLIFEKNGQRIGILALAQPEISAAKNGKWGAGVLEDRFAIEQTKLLRQKTDITIAYLHFGIEFSEYPTPNQVSLSHNLIDAGALLVIGHHPHVAQGYEYYKNGFIAYSLGNFLFDLRASSQKFPGLGLLIEADIKQNVLNHVKIIPIDANGGKTKLLQDERKKEADIYLKRLSSVIINEKELKRCYYFTCRDNFQIHINVFIQYSLRKINIRRLNTLLSSQFWPQISKLRIDLIRFILSGDAFIYEKSKGQPSEGLAAYVWRGICLLFGSVGLVWDTMKNRNLTKEYIDDED